MVYEFTPRGVCSRKMIFEIENGIITDLNVVGGCNGNLKGISSLVKGMSVEDVIERLSGIKCGMKSTSCPDQMANALRQFKEDNKG